MASMRMQILNWLRYTGQMDLVELLTEPTPQDDIVDYFESLGFKRAPVKVVCREFTDVIGYATTHLGINHLTVRMLLRIPEHKRNLTSPAGRKACELPIKRLRVLCPNLIISPGGEPKFSKPKLEPNIKLEPQSSPAGVSIPCHSQFSTPKAAQKSFKTNRYMFEMDAPVCNSVTVPMSQMTPMTPMPPMTPM